MLGYLIKDTTVEERKKIVEESLGNIQQIVTDACQVLRRCTRIISREKEKSAISIWNSMLVMSEETWTKRSEEAVRCDLSRIGRILILKCGLWGNRDEEKIN